MKIDLRLINDKETYRFIRVKTGRPIKCKDIVTMIDTETGHYTGWKVVKGLPIFDDDGRPIVVNGSMRGPVRIEYI